MFLFQGTGVTAAAVNQHYSCTVLLDFCQEYMKSHSVLKDSANIINCVHFQGEVLLVWGNEQ